MGQTPRGQREPPARATAGVVFTFGRGIPGFLHTWLVRSFGYLHLAAQHILPAGNGAGQHRVSHGAQDKLKSQPTAILVRLCLGSLQLQH